MWACNPIITFAPRSPVCIHYIHTPVYMYLIEGRLPIVTFAPRCVFLVVSLELLVR